MSGWNTSYGIRTNIGMDEVRKTFGTFSEALRVTGGNMSVIQLYMHNPDRITGAPSVEPVQTEFAKRMRVLAEQERAVAAFNLHKTVTGVAAAIGVCRDKARRLLAEAGARPVAKV